MAHAISSARFGTGTVDGVARAVASVVSDGGCTTTVNTGRKMNNCATAQQATEIQKIASRRTGDIICEK